MLAAEFDAELERLGLDDQALVDLIRHLGEEPVEEVRTFIWRTGANRVPGPVVALVKLFAMHDEDRRRALLDAAARSRVE